ncbi:MAG: hypothetical protein ACR2PK_07045 [Acidimicrobiales bacterium]
MSVWTRRAHFHSSIGIGLLTGAFVLIAILAIDAPRTGSLPTLAAAEEPDVLGKVEVRERQADPLDGRTTRFPDAAPGLTHVDSAETAAPRSGYDVDPPSSGELGEAALALVSYDWARRLPGWTIRFEDADRDVRGLTFSRERLIEIYVRPTDSAADLARVVAHELGHAVDVTHNTDAQRQLWRNSRDLDASIPWWPQSAAVDFATGAGDFAECFASWLVSSESLSQVGGECSDEDLLLVASLA